MAQLKDLIVNGATRLLNGLNVSGSIKQNSEQVVTKVNNIAPDDSGHLSVSIPTVNNATLTINQNNTSKGTFTANSSTNTTINLTDTTYSSQAAASGGTAVSLVTTGEKYTWNNKGTYSKPSTGIPKTDLASAVQTSLGKADTALQSHQDISGKENTSNKVTAWSSTTTDTHYPSEKLVKTALDGKANSSHTQAASTITGLATVATSGSYNDLSNKPTVPTKTSQLTNDSGFITSAPVTSVAGKTGAVTLAKGDVGLGNVGNFKAVSTVASQGLTSAEQSNARANIGAGTSSFSGSYNDLTNKPTIPSAVTESTVSGWGFTKNTGTYSKPSTGIPKTDLASAVQTSLGKADTALQTHQDISGKENTSNKVSSWSSTTTDTHYPSEKLVKTALDGKANSSHTHDDRYYTESEINTKISSILPATNTLISNLGNPTVFETGIIDAEFTNKIWFIEPSKLSFEESTDGTTYTAKTIDDSTKKGIVADLSASYNITIPKGNYLRITLTAPSYVYLNMFYMYGSSSGGKFSFLIEKHKKSTNVWTTEVPWTNEVSSWPGHHIVRHNTIPWTTSDGDSYFDKVRVTIHSIKSGTSSDTTYPTAGLYGIQWWGGYPSGNRHIYTWDYDKNIIFPAAIKATNITSKGSATQPIYFDSNGIAQPTTYTLSKSVPSDAKFTDTTYSVVSTSANGLAPKVTDTSKFLKGDGTWATPSNTNTWRNIKMNGTEILGTGTGTGALGLTAGSNVSLTNSSGTITIAATDTVYTHPATHPASMIAGLATVATSGSYNDLSNKPTIPSAITVDTAISSTSTNPVQNKVIKTALDGKVSTVSGKGLSTNDYTTDEKNKLAGIASGAEVNVQADWNVTDTTSDAYIKNKPTIPSGITLYSSTGQNTNGAMTQKATTDALNGKANTSHTQAASTITGLATVATTGSYNSLSNTPDLSHYLTDNSQGTITSGYNAPLILNSTADVGSGYLKFQNNGRDLGQIGYSSDKVLYGMDSSGNYRSISLSNHTHSGSGDIPYTELSFNTGTGSGTVSSSSIYYYPALGLAYVRIQWTCPKISVNSEITVGRISVTSSYTVPYTCALSAYHSSKSINVKVNASSAGSSGADGNKVIVSNPFTSDISAGYSFTISGVIRIYPT